MMRLQFAGILLMTLALSGLGLKNSIQPSNNFTPAEPAIGGNLQCMIGTKTWSGNQSGRATHLKNSDVVVFMFKAADQSVISLSLQRFSKLIKTPDTLRTFEDAGGYESREACFDITYYPKGYSIENIGKNFLAKTASVIISSHDATTKTLTGTFEVKEFTPSKDLLLTDPSAQGPTMKDGWFTDATYFVH